MKTKSEKCYVIGAIDRFTNEVFYAGVKGTRVSEMKKAARYNTKEIAMRKLASLDGLIKNKFIVEVEMSADIIHYETT